MYVINARNVHEALPEGIRLLSVHGGYGNSRAGGVLTADRPVVTVYTRPWERVIFWPERDANPFFHLMEALWMIGGRNDVKWIERYNSRMRDFSDDGVVFHGAYGHRWRHHFETDQIASAIALLKNVPNTRRCVIAMWDPSADLRTTETGKDLPCNVAIFLRIVNARDLQMTVMCRSNDIIWGLYGANAVHFSILQEYIAAKLGLSVGLLYTLSNDYHAYTDVYKQCEHLIDQSKDPFRTIPSCPYGRDEVFAEPLMTDPDTFDDELAFFLSDPEPADEDDYINPIFETAATLRWVYMIWKREKDYARCYKILDNRLGNPEMGQIDWVRAAREWFQRREAKSHG